MLAILSPAKTLDLTTSYPDLPTERPILEKKTEALISVLNKLTPIEIEELMSVSPKLAELNYARFKKWECSSEKSKSKDDLRPAIYMFSGDVYRGLDVNTLSLDEVAKLNEFTYILSGLYGILKPLTLIRPYRLEMGTPLITSKGNDLYQFWGKQVISVLNKGFAQEKTPILINLASEEYYRVIKPYLSPPLTIIHPVFLDRVRGIYKIVSFHAKKARGLMARFMVNHHFRPEHLKKFDLEGYRFSQQETKKWNQKKFSLSKNESTLVFLRDH